MIPVLQYPAYQNTNIVNFPNSLPNSNVVNDLLPDEAALLYGLNTGNHDKFNDLLYQRKKYDLIMKYSYNSNYPEVFSSIKNDVNFIELTNHNLFSNAQGLLFLVDIMSSLKNDRQRLVLSSYNPYYYDGKCINYPYPQEIINYGQYNLNDYLRMLNDFVKSNKVSEDLKRYFIITKSKNIDVYYKVLNKLNSTHDTVDLLTQT